MPFIVFLILLVLAIGLISMIVQAVIWMVVNIVFPAVLIGLACAAVGYLIFGIIWLIEQYKTRRTTASQSPGPSIAFTSTRGFSSGGGTRRTASVRCRTTGRANCRGSCCE